MPPALCGCHVKGLLDGVIFRTDHFGELAVLKLSSGERPPYGGRSFRLCAEGQLFLILLHVVKVDVVKGVRDQISDEVALTRTDEADVLVELVEIGLANTRGH